VVNIKLDAKDMPAKDLEAFLPALGIHLPKGASLAAGTLNTDLNITGPTNKLITNGTVGLFKAKIANFDLGSKMSTISTLTGLKTGQDLDIEKLTTNLRMAPDGLQAENFLAVVPAPRQPQRCRHGGFQKQSGFQDGCHAGQTPPLMPLPAALRRRVSGRFGRDRWRQG